MRRERSRPRPDWQSKVVEQGLVFGTPAAGLNGRAVLGRVGALRPRHGRGPLARGRRRAAALDVSRGRRPRRDHRALPRLRPARMVLGRRWRPPGAADPHLYGRFDLRYDGRAGEADGVQRRHPDHAARGGICSGTGSRTPSPTTTSGTPCTRSWSSAGARSPSSSPARVHFCWSRPTPGEDHVTVAYLQETAVQAGIDTTAWRSSISAGTADRFLDLEEAPIARSSSSTPGSGSSATSSASTSPQPSRDAGIEPLWKTLLSNKALLAILWEMYPGHPNLLPA